MKLEERAAYLQQLKAEAKLDSGSAKEKLLMELTDTVSLLCHQVYRMDAVVDGLNETLALVQEQLETVSWSEEPEDEYFEDSERPLYEVKCPQCGDQFAVDEATLVKGFSCPTCGECLVQAES